MSNYITNNLGITRWMSNYITYYYWKTRWLSNYILYNHILHNQMLVFVTWCHLVLEYSVLPLYYKYEFHFCFSFCFICLFAYHLVLHNSLVVTVHMMTSLAKQVSCHCAHDDKPQNIIPSSNLLVIPWFLWSVGSIRHQVEVLACFLGLVQDVSWGNSKHLHNLHHLVKLHTAHPVSAQHSLSNWDSISTPVPSYYHSHMLMYTNSCHLSALPSSVLISDPPTTWSVPRLSDSVYFSDSFHLSHNSAYLTLPCLSHYSVYCHNTQPIWHFPVCLITQSTVTSLSLFDIYFPVCLITQSIVTTLSLFDIYFPVCLITQSIWHFPVRLITQSIVTLLSLLDISLSASLLSLLSHYSAYLTFPCPSHYSVYCHITQPIWHFPVCLINQSTVTFTWPIWHFCLSQQPEYLCFLAKSIVSLLLCWITQSTVSSMPHYSDPSLSHYSVYCLFTQPISDFPVPQSLVSLLSRSLTFRYPITQLILIFHCLITQSISIPPSQYSVCLTFPCLNTQSVSDFPLSHYSVYLRLSPVS